MTIGYRPNIDPGGGATSASTDAIMAHVRHFVALIAGRRRHPAGALKMALVMPIAAIDTRGSASMSSVQRQRTAYHRSSGAGAAAQIP